MVYVPAKALLNRLAEPVAKKKAGTFRITLRHVKAKVLIDTLDDTLV